MRVELLGIDIAKNVFHVHGVDNQGREVFKERVYRSDLLERITVFPQCRIVMEACGGSNYWARTFEKAGHQVQLIAPQYVKPFVQRNKNDWKDAEAICIAARQPTMRYVPRREEEQQDLQNLHRVRERLVKCRTALINEMRGLLNEYGIVLPKSRRVFAKIFLEIMSTQGAELSYLSKETFYELWEEYQMLEKRFMKLEDKIKYICKNHPICKKLIEVPGVGYLTATAIVAAARDVSVFKNGREFAAWLGLTPKEHSTGGKQRLGKISKRGDVYLRKLLVHGARITLRYLERHKDRRSSWAKNLLQRKGMNRTAVAVANKNARVIWALMARDESYKSFPLAA